MTTRHPQLGAPARSGPTGELRALTGLRIVAAAWVVLFHFHFTPLPGVAEVVAVFGPLLTAGALGVDLFFVLSGFVIAHTYLEQLGPALRVRATAGFVWARACRLWPAYAVVFHLFGLWLAARWYLGSGGEIAFQAVQPVLSVGEYAQQLVMVQLWDDPRFDGASWVGSTWSISAEWLAYLLFPVTALAFFRLRRLPATLLGAGAVALMAPLAWAYLSTGSPYYDWSWLVRILCGFGGGVLAYLTVRRIGAPAVAAPAEAVSAVAVSAVAVSAVAARAVAARAVAARAEAVSAEAVSAEVRRVAVSAVAVSAGVRRVGVSAVAVSAEVRRVASVLAAVLPVLIAAGLLAGQLLGPGRGGAVILLFPVLVGALAVADRGPALVLARQWAVAGGRISYCLYLVHIPMLEMYWLALRHVDALGPTTWLAHLTGLAVVAATFVVAAAAFRLVEEPARHRMRRLPELLASAVGPGRGAVDAEPGRDHEPGPAFPVVSAGPAAGGVGARVVGGSVVGVRVAGGSVVGGWVAGGPVGCATAAGESVGGAPAAGVPAADGSIVGGSAAGVPAAGVPGAGGSVVGGSAAGVPAAGVPGAGGSVVGAPIVGVPAPDAPGAGGPAAGGSVVGGGVAGVPAPDVPVAGRPAAGGSVVGRGVADGSGRPGAPAPRGPAVVPGRPMGIGRPGTRPALRPSPRPRPRPRPAADRRIAHSEPQPAAPGPLLAALLRADGRRGPRRVDLRLAEFLRVDFPHTGG